MSGWETRIATGNPQVDQATVEQHRSAAAAQGLSFDVQPIAGAIADRYADSEADVHARAQANVPGGGA